MQVGIIRGVEVELQTTFRDLQDAAKVERDKVRKWQKMATDIRGQLTAMLPEGGVQLLRHFPGNAGTGPVTHLPLFSCCACRLGALGPRHY